MKFIKKHWYLLIIVVGLLTYTGVQQTNKVKSEKEKSYRVRQQTLKEVLTLSGEIDADEKATLRFQTSGRLAWVGVKEGDYVKQYQMVAALDQRELKKTLDKKLNDYLKNRWDFDQTLDDNKVIVNDKIKRIVDKAQFDLNKAVLDVELQSLTIELANLFTPIEGLVVRVASPKAGVNITPTQAEFEVLNPNTVFFSALADQTDVVNFSEGMSGEIILDAYPDEKIRGTISQIAFTPKEDETGTVYQTKMTFTENNNDYRYRLGMTGDAEFTIKEIPNVLVVPASFIKSANKKKYVWISENGKRNKAFVETGETIESLTEIKSGLKEGDIVYD